MISFICELKKRTIVINIFTYSQSAITDTETEVHQQAVELLLGCFEGLADEVDAVVRKRRLSVICRIVRTYGFGSNCATLAQDLGLLDSIG